ncbi:MAG: hypothetical protein AMJ54_06230 [Deltaproteobacteria bacterium SG8_13]|nr:MAG: hypothetical protein AMJ54_06230 [Deltaproteobacteria bacterium SG8_13]
MEEQVQFKNHLGETLAGTLHLPQQSPTRGVVLGHCFTCTRHTGILRRLAGDLADAGFIALRFDFSGNGQSGGDFSRSNYSKQVLEMQTAADLVAARGAEWIGMAGHSLGGLISLLDKTGEVSFTSRGRFLKITEEFFADAEGFDLPALLASFNKPLMMIHGDQDEIIPVAEAHRAREASGGRVQLEIISGADHMFSTEQHSSEASRLATNWFEEQSLNRNPSS